MPETLAAVDVGTNSLHLVVARTTQGERFEVLTREKEMVRLGHGSREMKQLAADAIDRAVAALDRFRRIAQSHDAPLRAVATSAVREAENRKDLLRRARKEAGVEIEVVSGVEEARLIQLGVLQALEVYDRRMLLCDIGGGSTELLLGERGEVLGSISVKLGAVRLTDRFFATEGLHPSAVDSCRRHVRETLAAFDRAVRHDPPEVVVGCSGTIEQVLRSARCLEGREPLRTLNGASLRRDQVAAVLDALIEARARGAAGDVAGLDPKRADIALAGALVLEGVVECFDVDELVISEYALREGVFLDTVQRRTGASVEHLRDVARRSVLDLQGACDEDPAHSRHVAKLALDLWDETADLHQGTPEARGLLEAAALLVNVGLAISHTKHHKHSYYVIRNSDRLVGFTDGEIELVAQIARYHRKSPPKQRHAEWASLDPDGRRTVALGSAILRVAIGLDRSRRQLVRSVTVQRPDEQRIRVVAHPAHGDADVELERWSASERTRPLADVLGCKVDVAVG